MTVKKLIKDIHDHPGTDQRILGLVQSVDESFTVDGVYHLGKNDDLSGHVKFYNDDMTKFVEGLTHYIDINDLQALLSSTR